MKRLLILFAIFALALVAMPVIAAEPAGPPGVAEVRTGSQLFALAALAVMETAPIRFEAVGVSNYFALDVAGISPAVIGSPGITVENSNCLTVPLAGLMYGNLKNDTALKYLGTINTSPQVAALAT